MARERTHLFAMNGGEISPLALNRIDLTRMRITAETMVNCFPRVIGPMQFRPGLGFGAETLQARNIPFVFAADDTALVELSNLAMRIVIDGTLLARPAVTTTVPNGDFSSATGWSLSTTNGGVATISGGILTLRTPTRGGTAQCVRSITVALADRNIEHALRVVVTRGPVIIRVGASASQDNYIRETELGTGTYSLAFTPTGNFTINLSAKSEISITVDSITIEAAGTLSLPAPWTTADLRYLRWAQSGDVIFVTNTTGTYRPMRIERRAAHSWGIVEYEFKDGPWRSKSATSTQLRVNAQNGNTTMDADRNFFRSEHVGQLFRIFNTETVCTNVLGGDDEYGDTIRVTGTDNERNLTYSVTGTWTGELTLQVSYDEGVSWNRWLGTTINHSNTNNPPGSPSPVLIRWGFLGSDHTSGSATVSVRYTQGGGGGWGVVRVTGFVSATQVNVEVVSRIHNTEFTKDWEEGRFSDLYGWPSAIELFDGRLWLTDRDQLCGSVSDDFTSFDLDEEGDSGPIIRSIATGAVNRALWIMGLARLCIGTIGAEPVGRSSSFDEPITPENFSLKDASTQGSADVAAVKIDRTGIFIQRSGKRAYLLYFSVDSNDYTSEDVSRFNPTILAEGVVGIAVQRQPDTRVWFWMEDGSAACLILERSEDVISWCRFETDGLINDISVLPNTEADDVYMIVARVVGGVTKYYREKLAYDTQAEGDTDNYMADSFVVRDIVATATVGNLSHLEGEEVVVWFDGSPILDAVAEEQLPRRFTVTGGEITLPAVGTGRAIVGLYYEGRWKSTKLAYAAQGGSPMSMKKQVVAVAPLLYKTHNRGIKFGQKFGDEVDPVTGAAGGAAGSKMDFLPRHYKGQNVGLDHLFGDYDYDDFALPGSWDNDARLCMLMRAPMPATVLGTVLKVEGHENG